MILRWFNSAWEKEREAIEKQLVARISEEIDDIDKAMKSLRGPHADEDKLEFFKTRNALVQRRSFSIFESEKIALNRMQLRMSYLAVFMSAAALILSVLSVAYRS